MIVAAAIAAPPAVVAQKNVPATEYGIIAFGNNAVQLSDNKAVSMEIEVHNRYSYAISDAKWLKTEVAEGKMILNADENPGAGARTATLTIRSNSGGITNMTVTQPGWNIADAAYDTYMAGRVFPVRCVDACGSALGRANSTGENLEKSYDGKTSTFYHTSWAGFDSSVPGQWPVLEYYFTETGASADKAVEISSITYIPRQDGGRNGCFGLVDIEIGQYKAPGEYTWIKISDKPFDFKMTADVKDVSVPENLRKGIMAIRFIVRSGYADNTGKCFASCAEMQFGKPGGAASDYTLFTDDVLSALKPSVTRNDIESMADPFLKQLAGMMIDGTYSSEGLVSVHAPHKNVADLSAEWNSPGKYYDRTQGVTGVTMSKGRYVVMVSGISDKKGVVQLSLTHWHGHKPYKDANNNDVKFYVYDNSYILRNGINVIDVNDSDMALAYVNNFDTDGLADGTASDVKIHIIGGQVNGVLRSTMTNAEMDRVLDNAVYPCIDLVGSRVHSVWEVQALKTYTKGQYVRYINLLDQLIIWEHRLLGLEKYNRVPTNTTLAYVNYDYYMYQGGRGVTFMYDTQRRVCDPDVLMFRDDDAIWGLSHEWGHQHQMAPYFMWTGMAEVTNNIFSAYNVSHMGYKVNDSNYRGRYPSDKWKVKAPRIFLDDNYDRTVTPPSSTGETKTSNADGIVMSCRSDAKKAAEAGNISFAYNDELKQFAINQPVIPTLRSENEKSALNAIEAYSGGNGELILAPYVNLQYYFSEKQSDRLPEDFKPDLWPDLFESLRQNDDPQGSQIEKQGEADKYELIASIFNGNKNDKIAEFQSRFPESVWNTHNYIPVNTVLHWQNNSVPAILNFIRKISRLTGYNMWKYFERWGVITVAAIEQGDYGIQYYIMTEAMYDEFKNDMFQLEKEGVLKPLSDEMLKKISYCDHPSFDAPEIPNDRPVLPSDN